VCGLLNDMADRDDDRKSGAWSEMEPHEEFLELCALATSGELSEEEQRRLRAHLAVCRECREALKEFEATVDLAVPLLSAELSPEPAEGKAASPGKITEFPAPAQVPSTPEAGQQDPGQQQGTEPLNPGLVRPRNDRVNWDLVWIPFAACILLAIALAIYSYRIGSSRSQIPAVTSNLAAARIGTLEQELSDAGHEQAVFKAQLGERDRTIAGLRHQIEQQTVLLGQVRSAESKLEQSAQTGEAERQQVAQERSNLAQKLDTAQASVQKMQSELDSLREQRSADQARSTSLAAQINDLSAQLRNREQAVSRDEELLSHDRDIRDLMGARDLYIAEVYDVAGDGRTKKPYGRLFYTRGKSLIFYAYDLDQQGGLKNASTFQAWGRRGPDKEQAVNLGVFYEDSVAKKRWVLKANDSNMLEQIDAVFVTVEPNGGSHKPTGKPLLFAYLKVEPNHP
jgi:hypothetical protein